MSLPQNSLAQGRARGQSQGDSQAEPQSELSRVGVRRQRPASGSPSVRGLQGPSLCSDCVCRALPTPPAPHFSCSQLIRACPWEQQPGRGAGEGLPGALQPAAPKKTLDEDLLPCPPHPGCRQRPEAPEAPTLFNLRLSLLSPGRTLPQAPGQEEPEAQKGRVLGGEAADAGQGRSAQPGGPMLGRRCAGHDVQPLRAFQQSPWGCPGGGLAHLLEQEGWRPAKAPAEPQGPGHGTRVEAGVPGPASPRAPSRASAWEALGRIQTSPRVAFIGSDSSILLPSFNLPVGYLEPCTQRVPLFPPGPLSAQGRVSCLATHPIPGSPNLWQSCQI